MSVALFIGSAARRQQSATAEGGTLEARHARMAQVPEWAEAWYPERRVEESFWLVVPALAYIP